MHCMHASTLKALKKEQVFLVKATWGVLLSPPEYPFRPPNTAGIPRGALHSCPHTEDWCPFSWDLSRQMGTRWAQLGWWPCRDATLPTGDEAAGSVPRLLCLPWLCQKWNCCFPYNMVRRRQPCCPRGCRQARDRGSEGGTYRFVLHPRLLHGWNIWKRQTQKCQHSAWHFRHTSLWETLWSTASRKSSVLDPFQMRWFVDAGWRAHLAHQALLARCLWEGLMKGMPWGHMSCLALLPLLACVLSQNTAGPHCHLTSPDTHPKPAGPFNSLGSD